MLHCLQEEAPFFGYKPPRFDPHYFRVRYVYGKWSPVDEDDELHMMVYGSHEDSATLFEVYLQETKGKQEIFIGDATTFKKENGQLETDEIPGGLATLRRIQMLFNAISRRGAITVRNDEVKAGPAACVYQR